MRRAGIGDRKSALTVHAAARQEIARGSVFMELLRGTGIHRFAGLFHSPGQAE
jgi:hypothetical protein